jgi:dTMP kinase
MTKGYFITFEGCEGSGKTTQAEKLYSYLNDKGYECILTHEPGGTKISEKIRNILLSKKNATLFPMTELLLYLASRYQHTKEIIEPAVRRGKIVISDRYADSSVAYQGAARNISLEKVKKLNKIATDGLIPDITFLIDIEPEKGLQRLKGKDRIEIEELIFHKNVRECYLSMAEEDEQRIKILDGNRSEKYIFSEILKILDLQPWFQKRLYQYM